MWIVWPFYGVIAAAVFVIGLASTPRPRAVLLMAVAAVAWPLAMLAVAAEIRLNARMKRVSLLRDGATARRNGPLASA